MSIVINKKAIINFLRNILISFGILLFLFVGVGVAYTWYMGQSVDVSNVIEQSTEDNNNPIIKPTKPADNVRVGVSIQMITSPIIPDSNAAVSIKTIPGSVCSIEAVYKEVKSTDSGLIAKTADDWGVVSWSWSVEKTVPIGKWPVNITCAKGDSSGFVRGDLRVVNQIE